MSPELILVSSAADAKLAREQLADRPADRRAPVRQRAGPEAAKAPEARPGVPKPRSGRRLRRTAVIVVSLIVMGSAAVLGLAGSRDVPGTHVAPLKLVEAPRNLSPSVPAKKPTKAEGAKVGRRPARPKARRVAPTKHAKPPTVVAGRRAAAKARKSRASARKTSRPARQARPARRTPRRVAGFVPARTWSWQAQAGARAYVFTLLREGRRVIRARTRNPRFVLPARFRFRPGHFRWRVVALGATPTGRSKPVVDSRFVLSRAASAAANR